MNNIFQLIKYGFVIGCVSLFVVSANAQNNTSAPYSMYGLGELRLQGNPHNAAMGNTGIGMVSSDFLNTMNPASYSGIDSLSFIFEMGLDGKFSNFKTHSKTAGSNDINFSYLALGWRINRKFSAGFGLNPFSSTGYEINTTSLIEGIQQEYPLSIIGSGDISRAYVSLSYLLFENLSLGAKTSFLFGSQAQTQYHDLTNWGGSSITNTTTDYFHNFYWEFGLQYHIKLKQQDLLTIGAIYCPRQLLVTKRINSTENSSGTSLRYEEESTGSFVIPEEYGIGFSLQKGEHLQLALDAGIQTWSDESYEISGVELKSNPYIRGGLDYLPSTNKLANFFKRVNYRLGVRFAKSYLDLRGIQLDNSAISCGFGLPIRRQHSHVDLSFELGQIGTTSKGLIQENYFQVRLGFALKDLWFTHPKYN